LQEIATKHRVWTPVVDAARESDERDTAAANHKDGKSGVWWGCGGGSSGRSETEEEEKEVVEKMVEVEVLGMVHHLIFKIIFCCLPHHTTPHHTTPHHIPGTVPVFLWYHQLTSPHPTPETLLTFSLMFQLL
jgi:hypothetical protein